MDDLAQYLGELRTRASEYGPQLRRNEALTRSALIDPVLAQLGWDVHDPGQVIPEFSAGNGRVDYALFNGRESRPVAFIEAKSLGTPLADKLAQAITYCNEQGVKYFAVSDGQRWEVYETFRAVPNPEKIIFKVDIGNDANNLSALRLLWLWRGNFTDGGNPETPSVPNTAVPLGDEAAPPGDQSPQPNYPTIISGAAHIGNAWKSLRSEMSNLRRRRGQPAPSDIRFGDGSVSPVKTWSGLQISTANWLVSRDRLNPSKCPIVTSQGTHIVHRDPVRSDGKPFLRPFQVAEMWLDLNYSALDHSRLAIEMISALGEDPDAVMVRWS
ncbi:MAG: type I restriction enzyme HsdR N-terminal domain-containing protein [Chloroflexi bacterium]|nr:type I restriction enzyme HsdR N-terminal domain-containing protein [Chloroflexota bacterium]